MPDPRSPDRSAGFPSEARAMLTLTTLPVTSGSARGDAGSLAHAPASQSPVRRVQESEELLFLFNPLGNDTPQLCQGLRDTVRDSYWSTSGSVTAALRRAVSVANEYLLDHNLNAPRSERCYGGIALAVLSDTDLFLLQAGPAWACFQHENGFRCLPGGEKLSPLGTGPIADIRLHHTLAAPDDTLLLAPHTLLGAMDEETLRHALSLDSADDVAAALKQSSSGGFTALIARCHTFGETEAARHQSYAQTRWFEDSSAPVTPAEDRPHATREPDPSASTSTPWAPEQRSPAVGGNLVPKARHLFERFLRGAIPAAREAAATAGRYLLGVLGFVWHGIAASGAGLLALGRWLMGAVGITVRSMLPGSGRSIHRRTHRPPPPPENRRAMTGIAIAIPLVIVLAVSVAYRQFAAASRFHGLINRAKDQIALAQTAESNSEEARHHWEAALQEAQAAATLQPEEPIARALRDQAQEALDQLDRIKRLTPVPLVNFGSSSAQRRLLLAGQALFVLDAAEGWVTAVPANSDSDIIERGEEIEQSGPVIAHTGQQVEGHEIGHLVDCAWVGSQGGRRSSALLILEEHGRLVSYDPAWRTEDGAPHLSLLELRSPPRNPVVVGSYQGQFYVLDPAAEGGGQIWRYKPQGDAYSAQPEAYFPNSPPQSLEQALDMAIDGHIYVLYEDGTMMKFLGGESQPFEVQGVPGGLEEIAGFAVDPDGDGTLYLADRTHRRIVVLSPEGRFQWQYRADPPLTALEALAVDQSESRLYLIAGGEVYRASLP